MLNMETPSAQDALSKTLDLWWASEVGVGFLVLMWNLGETE